MMGLHLPVAVHVDVAFVPIAVVSTKLCPSGHENATTVPMSVAVVFVMCVNENGVQVTTAITTSSVHTRAQHSRLYKLLPEG